MTDLTTTPGGRVALLICAVLRDGRQLRAVVDRSYWHPNGFAKLVLRRSRCTALRLHVWPAGDDRAGDSNPHTHVWSFASTVVVGSIDEVRYRDVTSVTIDAGEVPVDYQLHRFTDANERRAMTYDRPARLVRTDVTRYVHGDSYTLTTDVVHTVHPVGAELAVTLVRTARPLRDYALVYGVPGKDVAAPGAPLSVEEGRRLLTTVLEAL